MSAVTVVETPGFSVSCQPSPAPFTFTYVDGMTRRGVGCQLLSRPLPYQSGVQDMAETELCDSLSKKKSETAFASDCKRCLRLAEWPQRQSLWQWDRSG